MPTKIPWTDESWPVVTGCYPCSMGCKNCYAARMAATRLKHHPRYERLAVMYEGRPMWTGKVNLNHDVLEQPLHWRKPRMIFVASMGDLFHENVPDLFIAEIWRVMYMAKEHTFQILTKRPDRMLDRFSRFAKELILPNVWLGVSVENQAAADERIPRLLQTPAAVRFVSVEPYLSAVDLSPWLPGYIYKAHGKWVMNTTTGRDLPPLSWVICGAESGPGARPMDEDWVRDLRDQCIAAGTPFFYKQAIRNGRRVHMPELDGQVWDQFPVSVPGQP